MVTKGLEERAGRMVGAMHAWAVYPRALSRQQLTAPYRLTATCRPSYVSEVNGLMHRVTQLAHMHAYILPARVTGRYEKVVDLVEPPAQATGPNAYDFMCSFPINTISCQQE